jgi:hypothetical protein
VATLVSPFFDHPYAPNDFRASPLLPKLAQWKTVWTLPSLWTHRTRPQGTWKTAQTAVFHSAHTDRVFLTKKKRNNEEHCKCANPIVSTEGFTPPSVPRQCAQTGPKTIIRQPRLLAVWNAFAALDLVVALTLAFLSAPGTPYRVFTEGPGTVAMTTLPWIIVATFLVALYLLTHFTIAARMRLSRKASMGRPEAAPAKRRTA